MRGWAPGFLQGEDKHFNKSFEAQVELEQAMTECPLD